jgi:GNAT superfamily N-acetyltransferase
MPELDAGWLVHDATDDDLPELARLMAASPLLRRYATTYDVALEALREGRAEGDLHLVIRRRADPSPCGLAWVIFTRALNYAAYLRLLLVAEDAQSTGAGALLMREVEARARSRANHLYLLVTRDNLGARRFYERLSFRAVGDLPALVTPDLDEVLYHKRLRPYDA